MTLRAFRRAVWLLLLLWTPLLEAQSGQLVIETRVVRVPVTVTDRRRRFVTGLQGADFEVLQDGLPQELTSFAIEDSGIAAVMLLDLSASMTARLPEARKAAVQFIRQLGPNDVLKIVTFDDAVRTLVDFSGDKARLEAAVLRVQASGSTALHDALWTALANLEARRAEDEAALRHRAIVVLSDGDDTASGLRAEEVLARARRVDAIISTLSLNRQGMEPAVNASSTVFLKNLADMTGGQLLFPELNDLQRAYRDLADELRHQYTLGYVPKQNDPTMRYHRIEVRVKGRTNLTLRHRPGYFAVQ